MTGTGVETTGHSCGVSSRGIAAVITAGLYAASAACAQGLEGYLGDWELNTARFGAQFILSSVLLCVRKQWPVVERHSIGWLLLVSALQCVNNLCIYAAAPLLPMGVVMGLERTLMMAFGVVYEVVLQRRCSLSMVTCLVVCSAGVVLATQPTFLGFPDLPDTRPSDHVSVCNSCGDKTTFDNISLGPMLVSNESFYANQTHHSDSGFSKEAIGYIEIVISSIAISAMLATIHSKLPKLSSVTMSFWSAILSSLVSLVVVFASEGLVLPSNLGCWALFSAHSWSVGVAGILNLFAAQGISAFVLTLIYNLDLVVLGILQFTLLKDIQPGHRNSLGIVGIVLIIIGNSLRPIFQYWHNRQKRGDSPKNIDEYEELK